MELSPVEKYPVLSDETSVQPLIDRFFEFLQVNESTRQGYLVCLRCFADWLAENEITAPKRADIIRYVNWLSAPHPRRARANQPEKTAGPVFTMAAGTQIRYFRVVKLFFRWTAQEGLYPNVADHVKGAKAASGSRTTRAALQKDEARRLLESIGRDTPAGKRDYAMILLAVTAGLRIIEMQRADVGDLEWSGGELVLYIQGKGHTEKDDFRKVCPAAADAIREYLAARDIPSGDAPLFAGEGNRSRGQRLTVPSISRMIKERLRAAGFDSHRLSAHSLRHSSITFLLESGATLQEAQHHARHASPETTGIYAHNLERRKTCNEQRIYDFIFGTAEHDAPAEAADCLRRMTEEQQKIALELLKALSG